MGRETLFYSIAFGLMPLKPHSQKTWFLFRSLKICSLRSHYTIIQTIKKLCKEGRGLGRETSLFQKCGFPPQKKFSPSQEKPPYPPYTPRRIFAIKNRVLPKSSAIHRIAKTIQGRYLHLLSSMSFLDNNSPSPMINKTMCNIQ